MILRVYIVAFLLSSCSSLNKTLVYSGAAGALTGGVAGSALSPNKESRQANALIWGLVGAGVAAGAGYLLYNEDPRNYKLKNMLRDNVDKSIEIDMGALQINAWPEKKEAYKVPVVNLPKELKGKVGSQWVIKHQSKERYINQGKKTYYIPPFVIYEHSYGEMGGRHYEK